MWKIKTFFFKYWTYFLVLALIFLAPSAVNDFINSKIISNSFDLVEYGPTAFWIFTFMTFALYIATNNKRLLISTAILVVSILYLIGTLGKGVTFQKCGNISYQCIWLLYPITALLHKGYEYFCIPSFEDLKTKLSSNQFSRKWDTDHVVTLEDDNLKRRDVGIAIAELIQSSFSEKSSYTIAIKGPWGSGKSTLIEFIRKSLNKDKIICIELDHNLIFDNENPLISTLQFLEREISSHDSNIVSSIERLKALLISYSDNLYYKLLFHFTKNSSDSIASIKRDITNALIRSEKKLVVVCDDLDRMDAKELKVFLNLIRGIIDWGCTYFIVGCYPQALHKLLGEPINSNYLDKYFQISYVLPKVDEKHFRSDFINQLNTTFGKQITSKKSAPTLVPTLYDGDLFDEIKSSRDITLIMNALKINYKLVGNEVDFETLVNLELLKFYHAKVYQLMASKRKLYILELLKDSSSIAWNNDGKGEKPIHKIISDEINEELKDLNATRLIKSILNINSNSAKAISRRENYDTYFSHFYPKTKLSYEKLSQIVNAKEGTVIAKILNASSLDEKIDLYEVKLETVLQEISFGKGKLEELLIGAIETYGTSSPGSILKTMIKEAINQGSEGGIQSIVDLIVRLLRTNPYKQAQYLFSSFHNSISLFNDLYSIYEKSGVEILIESQESYIHLLQMILQQQSIKSITEEQSNKLKRTIFYHFGRTQFLFVEAIIHEQTGSPNMFFVDSSIRETAGTKELLAKIEKLSPVSKKDKSLKEFAILYLKECIDSDLKESMYFEFEGYGDITEEE